MKDFGVLVPIVTPCGESGDVDYEGLSNVCEDMIDAGCSGIFVAGSTGRGPWFSLEDRKKICARVSEITSKKGIPLFAGCMASGIEDMLENSRAMREVGADYSVITSPGYFIYNHREIEEIFLRYSQESPLPVLLYDIPVFTGMKLDFGMVKRLSKQDNIIGFKDSSADIGRFNELNNYFESRDDFMVLQGKEHLLLESLKGGASGFVVGLVHIQPKPFINLYEAYIRGDVDKAQQLQANIITVMELVKDCFVKRPETSTLLHFLNYCLKERAVCRNIMMPFEGDCPENIKESAHEALTILNDV